MADHLVGMETSGDYFLVLTEDDKLAFDEDCCCIKPIISISTCDSSVNYTQLCRFETVTGQPPGLAGPTACTPAAKPDHGPDGSCVDAPLAIDITKYNNDRNALTAALAANPLWPLAAATMMPGFKCWAGVTGALKAAGEPDPQDSFGAIPFVATGTSPTARMTLADLQSTFETLYDLHFPPADEPTGVRDQEHRATFLWDVDNSGSIFLSQWPPAVETAFLNWLAANYPKVRRRRWIINNYLVDGEDWIRRLKDHYLDTVAGG